MGNAIRNERRPRDAREIAAAWETHRANLRRLAKILAARRAERLALRAR